MELDSETMIFSLYERLMAGEDLHIIYYEEDVNTKIKTRLTFYRHCKKYFRCDMYKFGKQDTTIMPTTKTIKDFIQCLKYYEVFDKIQTIIENRNPIETSLNEDKVEKIIAGNLPIDYM